jgi:hypothetical protein
MRAALLAVVAAAGCSPLGGYHTARTLEPGRTDVTAALQVHGAGPEETGKGIAPELAIRVRRGLSSRVDASAQLTALPLGELVTSVSAGAGARVELSAAPDSRWAVSLGLSAGYRYTGAMGAAWETVHATVPLIIGLDIGDDQLVFTPTVGWQRWYSSGAHPVDLPFSGTGLGYAWRLTERYTLLPEISVSSSRATLETSDKTVLFHAGLALVIGR